ncbi:DUF6067 family protein [Niabella ginsengisoli]|uniref:DUF6067 family protein n=1 Tax=Niabella ginsengisoli TaxID=522298 RepID=A0ABS9SLW8_9BACT|nr:glycoside hydrolase domain-containing protein [Niabella ginsengisoli]MCH5599345.1 DUF6067 family protein [Niabella ginsengisoli]
MFYSPFFLCNVVSAQSIKYVNGNNNWDADSLGNHSFVVQLTAAEYSKNKTVAHVVIPWRRNDDNPSEKRIIIVSENGKQPLSNIKIIKSDNETGNILFEPLNGPGKYYIYYMPYKNEGRSNYPKGVYLKPEQTADESWIKQTNLRKAFAEASAIQYEAIDAFNSFYPMEVIATK